MNSPFPKIEASHNTCPQCGTIHPPLQSGEKCPVVLARLAREKQKQDSEIQIEKEIKPQTQTETARINYKAIENPNIDHVINGILTNLGVVLTNRINELELNTEKKVVALNKFRVIFEQKVTDCVYTFLEEFKA